MWDDDRELEKGEEGVMTPSLSEQVGLEDAERHGDGISYGKVLLKAIDRRARLSTLPFLVAGKSSKAM